MATTATRPSLLARVGNSSDQDAWCEFDRRYGSLVLRYCLRRGLQLSDAEDVRQVVMIALAKALPRFTYSPKRGRFRDYIGRVVRNAVARHHSKRKNSGDHVIGDTVALLAVDHRSSSDDIWEAEWVRHHCRLAFDVLRRTSDDKAMAIFERLLAGRTSYSVAEELGMTPEAVRKTKQRMRDQLRELIASQLEAEDEPDGQS